MSIPIYNARGEIIGTKYTTTGACGACGANGASGAAGSYPNMEYIECGATDTAANAGNMGVWCEGDFAPTPQNNNMAGLRENYLKVIEKYQNQLMNELASKKDGEWVSVSFSVCYSYGGITYIESYEMRAHHNAVDGYMFHTDRTKAWNE